MLARLIVRIIVRNDKTVLKIKADVASFYLYLCAITIMQRNTIRKI
uniref:Uncharacterized protein n=1 Tax=Neisseria meningitidis alpha275 TaxID=295996 RepID=C6SGK7_NEIME|nr:hypothetical protein predicted by Glimmer/Critica [Neisseria meningitidis alpha275]